jgi:hypothetical protein
VSHVAPSTQLLSPAAAPPDPVPCQVNGTDAVGVIVPDPGSAPKLSMPSEIAMNERINAAKMRGLKVPDSDEDIFRMTIQIVVELRIVAEIRPGPATTQNNCRARNIRATAAIRLPLFVEG